MKKIFILWAGLLLIFQGMSCPVIATDNRQTDTTINSTSAANNQTNNQMLPKKNAESEQTSKAISQPSKGLPEFDIKGTDDAAGKWGNCPWVYDDGILTFQWDDLGLAKDAPFKRAPGDENGYVNPAHIKKIEFSMSYCGAPTDCSYLFADLPNLESVDLDKFYALDVTDTSDMFADCPALKRVSFGEKWSTDKVTNMIAMFANCSALTELNLSNWNTRNVADMTNMFSNTTNLKQLNLGPFFEFKNGTTAHLSDPSNDTFYAGKWRNIGGKTGSVTHPVGSYMWTSDELMQHFNGATIADTYVWQPTGIYIDHIDNFNFPNSQMSGTAQTLTPAQKTGITITDALPKTSSNTKLEVRYSTPNDDWQKAGLTLVLTPTGLPSYIHSVAQLTINADEQSLLTSFDESQKQAAQFVQTDLAPQLTIPKLTTPNAYSTSLTWTLTQGPS